MTKLERFKTWLADEDEKRKKGLEHWEEVLAEVDEEAIELFDKWFKRYQQLDDYQAQIRELSNLAGPNPPYFLGIILLVVIWMVSR